MPKTLLKIAAGLFVVFLLVVGMVAVALPRLVDRDDFQARLREAAEEALDASVEWTSLEARVLPPRLTLLDPVLTAANANPEDARLTADSIDLRLAIIPIFLSRIEVASLAIRGAEIVVIRTPEGLRLPFSTGSAEPNSVGKGEAGTEGEASGEGDSSSFDLAIRSVTISDSRIILRDRTLSPAVEWRIEDFELEAGASLSTASVRVEMNALILSREDEVGRVEAVGAVRRDGSFEAEIEIDELLVAALSPYLGEAQVAGILSGQISIGGAGSEISSVGLDLRVVDAFVQASGFELGGQLRLKASRAFDEPVTYSIRFDLNEGGSAEVLGDWALGGDLKAAMKVDGLDLALFDVWIGPGAELGGSAEGEFEWVLSPNGDLARLKAELQVPAARYVSGAVDLGADVQLNLGLEGQGPIRVDANCRFTDGGQLAISGTSTHSGMLDLDVKLVALDLAMTEPFLPDSEMELRGLATGSARLVGPAADLESVELDVHVDSGILRVPDYLVEGPFDIDLKIDAPLSNRPKGRIDADLTAARLDYQEVFTKRAGMRASLTTTFSTGSSGEIQFESRIKLRNINEILLRGAFGEATSIAMSVPGFDLVGWGEVFPALEAYSPGGRVSLDDLGIESTGDSPIRFRGRAVLDNLTVTIPNLGQVRLRGSVLGMGREIETKDLRLSLAGTTLGIRGKLSDPLDARHFDLAVESIGTAEANEFFSALSSTKDTIFGDLQIAANLSGAAAGEGGFYSSLAGFVRVSVGEAGGGRLRGVSILQAILDQFPILGGAARLSQPFRSGKSIEDYFSEDFEVIVGDFEIGDGKVNARSLRLVYDGYEANLRGPVHLPSLEIDMTGEVLLKGDLVSALGGLLGARIGDRKPVRIPLAHVTNTLSEPKIVMTPKTLIAIPSLILKATGLDTLTLGIGRALGRALRGSEE